MKTFLTRIGKIPFAFAVGLFVGLVVTGTAWAYQSHMQNALSNLYAARTQLNSARSDKAGHRVSAIGLVNQAIGQVRAGIAAGAR
jgi:hypothetical protein